MDGDMKDDNKDNNSDGMGEENSDASTMNNDSGMDK